MFDRRALLKMLGGIAVASALPAAAGEPESAAREAGEGSWPASRPNLVCFVGEGVRPDEFSFAGNPLIHTPAIDKLAREGCNFRNSFTTNALCLPSRASMLTGKYSHTTGAVSNVEGKLSPGTTLLTELLQRNGYEVAYLGKSHIEGALLERDWDYYVGFEGQGDYYRPVLTEGSHGSYDRNRLYAGEYVDTLLTRKAVEWLRRKRTKPFCLLLSFYAPHAPFYRPKDKVNEFNGVAVPVPSTFDEDERGYPGKPRSVAEADNKVGYSEVVSDDPRSLEELVKNHYVGVEDNDRNIALVLDELRRQHIEDSTAVMLTADHGFLLGEHHMYDKRLMYEPSIRVPMLVHAPGRIPAGTENTAMVLNIDVAPTLLELAGVPTPADMQGRSFLRLAEGRQTPWREDWLYEYYEYPGFENIKPCRGVRTARYKYIHYFTEPQEFELYDLQKDPDEKANLYTSELYRSVVADMRSRLDRLRHETGDTYMYKPSGMPPHPSRQGSGIGASTMS